MDMSFCLIGSKDIVTLISILADVYSYLTTGLALKNNPKMTLELPKSVHRIKSYGDVFPHVS